MNTNYDRTIREALHEIGSPVGSLGSGSAIALALSIGVECLARQLTLTMRQTSPSEDESFLAGLSQRIDQWRLETQSACDEDAVHVGAFLKARAARDRASDQDRLSHVEDEVRHLDRANVVLLILLDLSLDLSHDAGEMFEKGVKHAVSEAITARHLAQASTAALVSMLVSNLQTLRRRRDQYGVSIPNFLGLKAALSRLPEGSSRESLVAELEEVSST